MKRNNYIFYPLILIVLVFTSCDKDNNHPGHQYYPDMVYSEAYESYSENPNFEDNMTLRLPPEGTVPRGYMPLPYDQSIIDRQKAGKELTNPFDYSSGNLERGKEMYARYCLQCHGPEGKGQGYLYTSGRYPYPIRSLLSEDARKVEDGQIFHTITYGFGVMGPHGPIVQTDDRWKIVLYIRDELQKQRPQ